ncbi:endo-1,4-beta-xylanase [Thermotoga sp. RQ2]|uniref:endo-1,4-beta-xylanase n=1 Tax=Thermotoga sp. (strain RQ2) TaxID=126740 RepID=UPI0001600BD4|nr:endo-1,4-beta-xylanase [Thermotoga sp. RQ2]ACB09885.1 Endo-1,4-beta-xylanase [Thermotoga sp. RQ2]
MRSLLRLCLFLVLVSALVTGGEIMNFEREEEGVSPFGRAVVTLSQDVSFRGVYSLKVDGRTSLWDGVEFDLTGKVSPGKEYRVFFYVYQTSNTPQLFSVLSRVVDESGERYEILLDKVVTPDVWKKMELIFTSPQRAEKFSLIVASPEKTNFPFYIDELQLSSPDEVQAPPPVLHCSFESETAEGWIPRGNAKLQVTSRVSHTGRNALLISERSASWEGAQFDLKSIVKPGKTYTFEMWVYQDSGSPVGILMRMTRKFKDEITTKHPIWLYGRTVPSGKWVRLFGIFGLPEGVDVDQLVLYVYTDGSNTDFYIDDVKIYDRPLVSFEEDVPSLKEVFKDQFKVGAGISEKSILTPFDLEFLKKHFNSVTERNNMKPVNLFAGVENGKLKFDFSLADLFVDTALKNGISVRGHTLVWHNQTPEWFFKDENGNLLSKEEMTERIREYIHTVVGHFKGKVYAWDVVNEAVDPNQPDGLRRSTWYQIMGPDYIELAFRFAREADPDAKLFYNDYNTFEPKKRDIIYNLVKSFKEKGLIDGIGMQCHISLATDIRQIEEAIKKFSTIPGIEIHITELDISVYKSSGGYYERLPRNVEVELAHKYAQLFSIFRKYSNVITSVTMFGLNDGDAWSRRNNWPFLFDEYYQTKLAFWGVVDPELLPPLPKTSTISEGEAVVVGKMDDSYLMSKPIEIYDEEGNVKATIRAIWKDSTIYVYGEVQDATKKPAEDGVAIFINPNNERTPYLQPDDTYVVLWTNWKSEVNREDVEVKKFVGPGFRRYSFEMSITIPGVEYRKDSYIGFDVAVIDDGKWYSWSDTTNSQKTNTMNYGTLKLEGVMVATAKYGTPVIDGEIDDIWNTTEEIETKSVAMGSLEKNATAKVRVLWDEENLYVLAIVKDPVLNKDNSNPWEQDSVEIFIDENNHKTSYYEDDDAQFRVNYMNEQSFGTGASAARFKTAVKLIEGGYIVEAAIKWKTIKPSPNTVIGFNVQVNDANEKGQRVGIISWSDPTNNSWRDPSKFGNLKLLK